ncbi:MAG: fused MFS/spermidine synthase [Nitrospirae bacterium]|nr:fused MFS/spermidine synthase [Nitrospirota bacterium]
MMKERIQLAALPVIFSLTLFVSAGLLFLVEPMIGKMILPLLGGTPAVWNTCMMFFQVLLLAGYCYAHIIAGRMTVKRQMIVHIAVLAVAFLVLPVGISRQWLSYGETHPIVTVLIMLLFSVGLPFFAVSASAPLLQKWFSATGHPSAGDPYFLYSASNVGSMLALISYPLLIEPRLALAIQSRWWSAGYLILVAMTIISAVLSLKKLSICYDENKVYESNSGDLPPQCAETDIKPGIRERLRWIAFSFVPSSLLLGVTTFISTNIAAIPLFWVVPLALYLLSFILVFARIPGIINRLMIFIFPPAVLTLLFFELSDIRPSILVSFLVHLSAFFITAMVCHGELARRRPSARYLTEFYLWMSFGGLLGGIFNAVIAPLSFNTILEYPLGIIFASLLLPVLNAKSRNSLSLLKKRLLYIGAPLILGLLTFWLVMEWPAGKLDLSLLDKVFGIGDSDSIITYAIPAFLCFGLIFMKRRFLFGCGVGAFVAAALIASTWDSNIVHRERSFFGVLEVRDKSSGAYRILTHGTTQHGIQSLDPKRSLEPLSYYHRQGPIGQVFKELSGHNRKSRIAIIGLGTGTLASYGRPDQQFTFYEIDPSVKHIATNTDLFTFLHNCRADWKIVLGDARLRLEDAPDNHYELMVIDAFSSDAIPVHLLTREALRLYLSKLSEKGLLAVHISNRYIDLEPVLQKLAQDAGLSGRIRDDGEDRKIHKYGSTWVIMSKNEAQMGMLAYDKRWRRLEGDHRPVWTDDFSNLLSALKRS